MTRPLLTTTRRRVSSVLRIATAIASVAVVATSAPANASTQLWAGFESGTSGVLSVTQNVDVNADCARTGSLGAEAVTTPTSAGFLKWGAGDLTQDMRYAHVRTWVKIEDMGADQNVGILNIKNANGSNHFDLWRDAATGKFRWDLYRGDTGFSTSDAVVGQWYRVDVLVDFGGDGGSTYTAQVRIDGVDQPTIQSTSQVGTTVRALWFGGLNLGYTNTRCYDSVSAEVASSPLSFNS